MCKSPKVQRAADKAVAAKDAVAKLEKMLVDQDAATKARFYAEIDRHLQDARITDAKEAGYGCEIKTEYASEFSLDKIAAVINASLVALGKSQTATAPALSSDAISAYADVVNSVAEAAKSSSSASASLTFSMNRLPRGWLAFLYASSVAIKDKNLFGEEAVTSTAIYYRLMDSPAARVKEIEDDVFLLDSRNLLNMKTVQAALTDDLASGKISVSDWDERDAVISGRIREIEARIKAHAAKTALRAASRSLYAVSLASPEEVGRRSTANHKLVHAALLALSGKGEAYQGVIEKCSARLASGYY